MKRVIMSVGVWAMGLLAVSTFQAAEAQITFSAPGSFTNDSVLISGPLVYAVNFGAATDTANVGPQNITFQADPTNANPNVSIALMGGGTYVANPGHYLAQGGDSGDPNFNTVLGNGAFNSANTAGPSGDGGIITLNNLVVGRTYRVQLILDDTTAAPTSFNGSTFTVNNTAGPRTTPQQYAYANGTTALGGYINGTFTAAATTQSFQEDLQVFLSGIGGPFDTFQVNALVLDVASFNLSMTPGLTPNQLAVAQNLDGDNPITGPLGPIIAAIGNGPTNQIGTDLDELSPESLEVFRNIAFDNFVYTADLIDNHLASLRYGEGGFDTSGLSVLNSADAPMLSQIRQHLLAWSPPSSNGLVSDSVGPVFGGVETKDAKDLKEITPVTDKNRWSAFVSGNVILADINSDPNVANAHYTTGDVTAGADYRLDDHWAVGALFGYGHTDARTDSFGSDDRVDSYSPGVYATYADSGWYANGLFTYDYNSYHETRSIPFLGAQANGSPEGNQYNADFDGGYEFHSGKLTYGPTAALQYVHLDINSFTEGGAGAANLAVNEQTDDSLRSRLGGEVRYNWEWYGGKAIATPHLSASWQHEYLDNSNGITSQFAGQGLGSFAIQTQKPDRDSAFIDLGIDTQWNSALSLYLDYQTQAGQSNFFAESIQGGVKVSF